MWSFSQEELAEGLNNIIGEIIAATKALERLALWKDYE